MARFICDSSVWIDYFNGVKNSETDFLYRKIDRDEQIAICPVILQEVLQGIRNDLRFEEVKEGMMDLDMLDWNILTASLEAVDLFRFLKKKGVTIRKGVDCLIACYATHHKIPILHRDRDFENIARHSQLKIVKVV